MSRIAYDLTLIRAVVYDVDGVLSPSTIPMGVDGVPMRMANIKDGYAMQLAAKVGLKQAIITGAKVESLCARYNALGISDVYLGSANKLPVLQHWMEQNQLAPQQIAYIGDDIPDIPVLRLVGLPVAPKDAAPEVRRVAKYISPANGGYGVARDLLEQVLAAQGHWLSDTHAFGW